MSDGKRSTAETISSTRSKRSSLILLSANAEWYHKAMPWVDFNYAQGALFNGDVTAAQWAAGCRGVEVAQ